MSSGSDRARRHTAAAVLRRIDAQTIDHLAASVADGGKGAAQLDQLDREWDLDRVIETEAAVMGLAGLALGVFVDRRLLALPGLVGAGVFLYAWTGRYPLLPLFRRAGVRTSREIQRERYALKAMRGDFSQLSNTSPAREPVPGGADVKH